MKNIVIGLIAVIALGVASVGLFLKTPAIPPTVGAASPEFFSKIFARDDIVVGGATFSTTSQGTVTYLAANLVGTKVIEHNATAALTATLPTNANLSAAGFLPNIGDTATIYIHASTTQITLAGSTGVTLNAASSTKVILPNTTARIDFFRHSAVEGRLIWALMTTANQ